MYCILYPPTHPRTHTANCSFYKHPYLHALTATFSPTHPSMKNILDSYSCSSASLLPISSLDPTLALGFYVRDRQDLKLFCRLAKETIARPDRTPLFSFTAQHKHGVVGECVGGALCDCRC